MKKGIGAMEVIVVLMAIAVTVLALDYFDVVNIDLRPVPSQPTTDLSGGFHALLDPLGEGTLDLLEEQCGDAGGRWCDEETCIGCFEMSPGAFDTEICEHENVDYIGRVCVGFGGTWVCDEIDAGCYI